MNLAELIASMPPGWNTGLSEEAAEQIRQLAISTAEPNTVDAGSGVYLLIDKGEVVYVGQSQNIYSRIGTHIAQRVKQFDSFVTIPVPPEHRIMRERQLIRTFHPFYNLASQEERGLIEIRAITGDLPFIVWCHFKSLLTKQKLPCSKNMVRACDRPIIEALAEQARDQAKKFSEKTTTPLFFT